MTTRHGWNAITICADLDKIHVGSLRSLLYLDADEAVILSSPEAVNADAGDATLDELERIGTAIVLAVARARRPAQAVVA